MLDELNMTQLMLTEYSKNFAKIVATNNLLVQNWKQIIRVMSTHLGGELPPELEKLNQSAQDLLTHQSILIDTHSKQLRNKTHEMGIQDNLLQNEFKLLRLVPAALLFQTIPRQVRDISQEQNKSIDVTIRGDDVRVDRMVLDVIKDPVIHILRNAIDHGIEDPATRASQGKNKEGKIHIQIYIFK